MIMREAEDRDTTQLTEKEILAGEVKTKLVGLLSQDGREKNLADLGPCLHVEYLLDTPRSIVGMEIPDYDDMDARLIINKKID